MKLFSLLFLPLALQPSGLFGGSGEVPPSAGVAPASDADAFRLLTPAIDLRTRYEFREVDGQDPSHALTARLRAGLRTAALNGFSAFAELEATGVLVDDYRSNPTDDASTSPYVPGNTTIGDPENIELNQAWAQYEGFGATLRAGRQRIIRSNAAFVGNVGWRQNEQTYDAVSLAWEDDALRLFYAYSNRVQRIFGSDANDAPPAPPLRDFEGNFHFFDISHRIGSATAGAYAFLVDVDNSPEVGSNNTFGAHLASGPAYVEMAWQDGRSSLAPEGGYDAFYTHLRFAKDWAGATWSAGLEYLEEGFKTPFATVHAFNGYADVFVLQRIGSNNAGGAYEGLSDLYLGYVRPGLPGGLTFKGYLHWFLDDAINHTYGYEADAVLEKRISDSLSVLLALSWFEARDNGGYADIGQVSLQTDLKF